MDPGENVPLAVDLPRVDLVEQRHQNERVEDDCKVLRRRAVDPRPQARIDLEEPVSCNKMCSRYKKMNKAFT